METGIDAEFDGLGVGFGDRSEFNICNTAVWELLSDIFEHVLLSLNDLTTSERPPNNHPFIQLSAKNFEGVTRKAASRLVV